ncbi:MAG: Tn3 family transposase [Sphingomonadaceae bacterium]|nr:Tn3 family transposase [Sphingomonadaceae bacterium]
MDRAVRHLRDRGFGVPETLLAHVAPLGWEHISLTGDYLVVREQRDLKILPVAA